VTAERLTTCLNCNAPLPTGHWCGSCGQNNRRPRLELDELALHALDELFSIDGRWWTTLKGFYPHFGGMATEYIEGHRARYVNPVRFVVVTATVLLVSVVTIMAVLNARVPGTPLTMRAGVDDWLPVAVLLSIPLSALLFRLVFSQSGRSIAECLVFALYGVAPLLVFLWLILGSGAAISYGIVDSGPAAWLGRFVLGGSPVYFGFAAARFFGTGRLWALVATSAIFILTSIIMIQVIAELI
jgi:Protein of unknown function (DUF3667)